MRICLVRSRQIKQIKLKLDVDYYLSVVTKCFVLGVCLHCGIAESKKLQDSCFSVILPVNTLRVDPVSRGS